MAIKPFLTASAAACMLLTTSLSTVSAQETASSDATKLEGVTIERGLACLDAREYRDAVQTFDKLFEAGNADGGFYLARMLELGLGVERNELSARALFLAAADKGSAKALNRVGLMYYRGEAGVLQNYDEAVSAFRKAHKAGDREAMFNLAELTLNGVGLEADPASAIALYQQAADAGHIGALNVLGLAYKNGSKVDRNYKKARGFFEKAATQGNPIALFQMATIYENGLGVGKDLVTAHQYYNLASALGFGEAAEGLKRVQANMKQEEVQQAQQKARDWKPAETAQGDDTSPAITCETTG